MKQLTKIQFLVYLAVGLFSPIWYKILFERGGSIDNLGLLFGIFSLGAVAAGWIVGHLAKSNPQKVLAIAILIEGLIMLLYIPNLGINFIYALQALYGLTGASIIALEQILIAQSSNGESKTIGNYNSKIQIAIGIAMISSGFLATQIGNTWVIVISVFILLITAVIAMQYSPQMEAWRYKGMI